MARRDKVPARGEERGADAGRVLVAAGAAAGAAARVVGAQGVDFFFYSQKQCKYFSSQLVENRLYHCCSSRFHTKKVSKYFNSEKKSSTEQ